MSIETQIPEEWSDAERWVWGEIRAGRIADFHRRYGKELDPKKPDGWDDEQNDRRLSQAFLVTVLTKESFRNAIPFTGVRINGACFEEAIDLQHARLERQLWIDHCRFHGKLSLMNLHINGWLSLEGSWLGGTFDLSGSLVDSSAFLNQVKIESHVELSGAKIGGNFEMNRSTFDCNFTMNGTKIGGYLDLSGSTFDCNLTINGTEIGHHLLMRTKASFKEVDLTGAKIDGNLEMDSSTFGGKLNMNGIKIGHLLLMHTKASFKEVDLTGAKIDGNLGMNSSTFDGKLNLNGTEVGHHLFMGEKASFKEVDLTGAKIDGQLDMSGSTFDGNLTMDGTEVGHLLMREKASFKEVKLTAAKIGGYLDMSGSTVKEVDLTGTKIGGNLDMSGSTFDGNLTMNGTEIGHHLLMRTKASFKEVDLTGAKIDGQLDMSGSTFDGKLTMDTTEIGESLFARSTMFPTDKEVVINFAKIGSNFDLSGATIGAIDLTATTITSELRLGSSKRRHEPTNWVGDSRMLLRNTTVDAIQDADVKEPNSWPQNMELEGFTYSRLGGFGAESKADIANRDTKWFIDWLERDKNFSPQPYEQLANVLHESGYPSKANAIRFAARKRSRRKAWQRGEGKPREWSRWIGLTLLQYTIGYGLGVRYFKVLWWFGGFTLIGFIVLLVSIENSEWDLFKMAWASFDQVLPIVKLNREHDELILGNYSSWTIAYFYVQKLIGYVLGGFLGAGLAGLTQKS